MSFFGDVLKTTAYANVEIGLHNNITYIVISEPEKSLFVFENKTKYSAILEEAGRLTGITKSKKGKVVPAETAANVFWLSPQADSMKLQFHV